MAAPTDQDPSARTSELGRHARPTARTLILASSTGVLLAAALAVLATSHWPVAPAPDQCAAVSAVCGFPDASDTGVPAGIALKAVPGQVSSGPGWSYDPRGWVQVSGNGAVLSGLYISCDLNIGASDVTVKDVRVVTGGDFAISLRHASDVTIEDSTISGSNATSGRVDAAIKDVYGDSTGTVVRNDNISYFRIGVEVSAGLVARNYIHNPGYVSGDHTNGVYVNGSNAHLTIEGNTILNPLGQTDAITLNASSSGQTVANKTIEGNLIAGGDYVIYGGASAGNATSNIVIKGNWFSQQYYPLGGRYGPAAYFDTRGLGNVWSGNVWAGRAKAGATPGDAGRATPVPPP
jgi:hypothetical protein